MHSPQQAQLRQQRGVLLGLLRSGLGSLLVLQPQALDLLQDLSEDGEALLVSDGSFFPSVPPLPSVLRLLSHQV